MRWILFLSLLFSFSCAKSSDEKKTTPEKFYRFFDRDVYFPTGVSVTPERSAANESIKEYLKTLEKNTLLGDGFFRFYGQEDSLLQPSVADQSVKGRPWNSFVQPWDDDLINTFLAENFKEIADDNSVVVLNELNSKQYFMIMRLSCFLSGASCSGATPGQAKALVYRSMGYLVGLQNGHNSTSAIMKPEILVEQDQELQEKLFYAEFNNILEDIINNVVVPDPPNSD